MLVAYDERGKVIDFGSLEIQAVYISGNVRRPFEYYMEDPAERMEMDWGSLASYYPRPDFLSSSRKRLVPQMLFKGGILKEWGKKQGVALQRSFYETLPPLPEVDEAKGKIADTSEPPLSYTQSNFTRNPIPQAKTIIRKTTNINANLLDQVSPTRRRF